MTAFRAEPNTPLKRTTVGDLDEATERSWLREAKGRGHVETGYKESSSSLEEKPHRPQECALECVLAVGEASEGP
jgi:hypothetical protein